MTRGILIILSGPSGVGKGTVRPVLFEHQELGLHYSCLLYTSRNNNIFKSSTFLCAAFK